MGSSVINALKNTLGMGARTNKYRVVISGVAGVGGGNVDVLAKSTSIPGRSFPDIEVWNQGRLTVIAGDASFEGTWSVTFMDNESHSLRRQFIRWMEFIDSPISHSREASSHDSYMGRGIVQQLSTINNTAKASYVFEDIWPKSISESSLSDETSDMVEFTVEFNYTSWSV